MLGSPKAIADGISIRRVLDTGGGFIRIAHDPVSGALHYLDGKANVYRLSVPAEGAAKRELVYDHGDIGGAADTSGMAFGPDGALYIVGNVTDEDTIQAIIRKGTPDSAGKRVWSTLASTAPYPRSKTNFDHVVNGIAVSPDGKYVYVNSGSRTDHGEVQDAEGAFPGVREVPLTSAIFRIPADANEVVLPDDEDQLRSDGYLFADGVRNSYDLEFAANGDLFAGDNGPDADYPDELNWLREGMHYGFPWRFGVDANPQQAADYNPEKDKRLSPDFIAVQKRTYKNDPSFPPAPDNLVDPVMNLGPDADQFRDVDGNARDASEMGQPLATFTPHRSPLGLSFDKAGLLPSAWQGDGFILSWGSAGGSLTDRGSDLLHLELTKNGDRYETRVTQIASSFDHPIDSAFLDGKLYVLDFGRSGAIWEITFQ